jgi:hypothetical protein
MKKITVILPIYKLDPEDVAMLNNALLSVEEFHNDVKVKLVTPIGLKSRVEALDFGQKLEVIPQYNSTLNTEFTTQVNLGIEECDTEWFSILEIDDEYKKVWLVSMNEYMNAYQDVDVFLPIVMDVNVNGNFTNYTNESVWAYGFTNKQGFLDNELLLEYQNYQTSGGLYRTKVVKDNGSFKNNIKLTFSYEFFLRLSNNGIKMMVVPKIGYRHVNLRENSLFWSYKNDEKMKLSEDEVKFWLDTAKKEYYFKNKRDIKYEKK